MPIQKITPNELYLQFSKKDKPLIIDVRAAEKFEDVHIEGSTNIQKTLILEKHENTINELHTLAKHEPIIVTCTTGNSAAKCAEILAENNDQVFVLEGGITAWQEFLKTI